MMHIIYAVMAISLTCLVAFGGISYMNADSPIRAVASRGLIAQYEAIHSGIVSYRNVNNGITPDDIALFEGFLPQGRLPSFGKADNGYEWTMKVIDGETAPVLCLTVNETTQARFESALNFARDIERRTTAKVSLGDECGARIPFDAVETDDVPAVPVLTVRSF